MLRRNEAEQVLGEWGVRDATPAERAVRDRLSEELEGSPLRGRPLRRRYRNFALEAAGYVASMGGPLPYMQRLRLVEDLTAQHLERLEEAWRALAAAVADPDEFARRWTATARRWSFYEVNDVIERHNRWYPVEARLPMDPRTGDFVRVGGRPYRREPLDAAWALERFPADRAAVTAGA